MARPTILTTELQAAICEMLRQGVPMAHAAEAAGCSESTFYAWRDRGKQHADDPACKGRRCKSDEHPYLEFLEETRKAKAKAVAKVSARLMERINAGDTKAIQFYLSHADRDNWHPRSRTDIGTSDEVTVRLSWPEGDVEEPTE